jgi:hypothetical protein
VREEGNMTAILLNPGFESPWADDHDVLIISPDGSTRIASVGNIFAPSNWRPYYYHDPGVWDQPEMNEMHADDYPARVHSGLKAYRIFTCFRHHSAGLYQQISVPPSSLLTVTAWAHAWSNHYGEHTDDPKYSEGVEYGQPGFWLENEAPNADAANFLFYVAVDPTGGTNPLADTVVWGQGAHIYNAFAQVPPVSAVAESDTITIYLNSKCHLNFKHNDGYWDDVQLTVHEPPQLGYPRAVVLFHPGMGYGWVRRVLADADWNRYRFSITANPDDAGCKGCAGLVTVIALNPHGWDYSVEDYFAVYYPWVEYVPVVGKQAEIGARVKAVLEVQ